MESWDFCDESALADFLVNDVNRNTWVICDFDLASALFNELCDYDETSVASVDLEQDYSKNYTKEYTVFIDPNDGIWIGKAYCEDGLTGTYNQFPDDATVLIHRNCNINAASNVPDDYVKMYSFTYEK